MVAFARLKGQADFLSIGTNDLMQYFFAADRGNARVSDRYDILSRAGAALPEAASAKTPTPRVCRCRFAAKRRAGRWKRMAFTALGFRRLVHAGVGHRPGEAHGAFAGCRATPRRQLRELMR